MYYVYFLVSSINQDLYIGSTNNLEKRVYLHNAGKVRSTKACNPWGLLDYEVYNTRSEAMKREQFLKTGQQKAILKKKYGRVAK